MIVPGAADSLDVLRWRVSLDPFIEFMVNLVAKLFVIGFFFSDSSGFVAIVGILGRRVFSRRRSWST